MLNRRSLVAAFAGAVGAPIAVAEGRQLPADMIQMSRKELENAMELAYRAGRLSLTDSQFLEQALRGELQRRKASGVEVRL